MSFKLASTISDYFRESTYTRKLQDTSIISLVMVLYGISTGTLLLNPVITSGIVITVVVFALANIIFGRKRKSTVEKSFTHSEKIKRILDNLQFTGKYPAVIHNIYHNGVCDLSGRFSFIKMTGVEHSTAEHINFNPLHFRDLPFMIDMAMLTALIDNKTYTKQVDPLEPLAKQYRTLNIKSICAAPINVNGKLNSFLLVGSEDPNHQFDMSLISSYVAMIESEL